MLIAKSPDDLIPDFNLIDEIDNVTNHLKFNLLIVSNSNRCFILLSTRIPKKLYFCSPLLFFENDIALFTFTHAYKEAITIKNKVCKVATVFVL